MIFELMNKNKDPSPHTNLYGYTRTLTRLMIEVAWKLTMAPLVAKGVWPLVDLGVHDILSWAIGDSSRVSTGCVCCHYRPGEGPLEIKRNSWGTMCSWTWRCQHCSFTQLHTVRHDTVRHDTVRCCQRRWRECTKPAFTKPR